MSSVIVRIICWLTLAINVVCGMIPILDGMVFDETRTEQIDAYNTRDIGWIKVYECVEGWNDLLSSYSTAQLTELETYAISIKFVPFNLKYYVNYDEWAVVAKPCSNPVKALNNHREISYVFNEGTNEIIEPANTDFWIGTQTAKNRLTNNLCGVTPPTPFMDYTRACENENGCGVTPNPFMDPWLYRACGNEKGIHIGKGVCLWGNGLYGHSIEVYFGFDSNKMRYCETVFRHLKNEQSYKCIYENSRPLNGMFENKFNSTVCDESDDTQLWEIQFTGPGNSFRLKNKKSTCCIEQNDAVNHYALAPDGTNFGCNQCQGSDRQQQYWTMHNSNGNVFQLKNSYTNHCMYQNSDGRFGFSSCHDTYIDQKWQWRIVSETPTKSPTSSPTPSPITKLYCGCISSLHQCCDDTCCESREHENCWKDPELNICSTSPSDENAWELTCGGTDCHNKKINCPTNAKCVVNCGFHACITTTILCPTNAECFVNCAETWACQNAIIFCPTDADCFVNCHGTWACLNAIIHWPNDADFRHLTCMGGDACQGMQQNSQILLPLMNEPISHHWTFIFLEILAVIVLIVLIIGISTLICIRGNKEKWIALSQIEY